MSHQWALVVFLALGAVLLVDAAGRSTQAGVSCAVYVAGIALMLATSAVYHRVPWQSAAGRARWRRLDHATIFALIGGTYTPVTVLTLDGTLRTVVLVVVWSGCLLGVLINLVWITAPRGLIVGVYLAVSWVIVPVMAQIADRLGGVPVALILLGGVLYTTGALCYARRRPNPVPGVFGYHEVFHAFVLAALAAHFAAIAFWVVPQSG